MAGAMEDKKFTKDEFGGMIPQLRAAVNDPAAQTQLGAVSSNDMKASETKGGCRFDLTQRVEDPLYESMVDNFAEQSINDVLDFD